MQSQGRKPQPPSKPGLRMKELVNKTGLPKSTILHYLSEGLLPEPVKTSPNMAYYDAQCIDRIKFIRYLQHNHRLSLSEIKQMMDSRGDGAEFSLQLELNELIFGQSEPGQHLTWEGFCQATGLTSNQVAELLRSRLLLPHEKDRFDPEDVEMGKVFARAFSWGIRVRDLTYYVELGDKIVDHEVALRGRITHHLPYGEDAAMTLGMVKNARMSRAYIIERLFQHRVAAMRDIKGDKQRGEQS